MVMNVGQVLNIVLMVHTYTGMHNRLISIFKKAQFWLDIVFPVKLSVNEFSTIFILENLYSLM